MRALTLTLLLAFAGVLSVKAQKDSLYISEKDTIIKTQSGTVIFLDEEKHHKDSVKVQIGSDLFNLDKNMTSQQESEDRWWESDAPETEQSCRRRHSRRRDSKKRFNGHWGIMEFGINSLDRTDYSSYDPQYDGFMDLNYNKSIEFNLNPLQAHIGLQKNRNTIGLITGIGFSWSNYRLKDDITLKEDDQGWVIPVKHGYENVKKSKLTTWYLTVPLMLEFQIPVNNDRERLYINGGVIGALKLNSHTKIKHGKNKIKDWDDFNLNPFRYGATARVGYGAFSVFANYYFTPLFQDGKGPGMYPFTIGIGIGSYDM